MCISIPAKVISATSHAALVEAQDGLRRKVNVAPGVRADGWVLISAGLAVCDITAEEAEEIRALFATAKDETH